VPARLDFERDLRKLFLVFFRPVGDASERVLYIRIHGFNLSRVIWRW